MRQNRFKLPFVIDLMTRRAAQIVNLPAGTLSVGAAADICLFDLEEKWTYDAKAGFSKSTNSPWQGAAFTGRVKTTIVDGRVVFSNGRIG
jgi:dihydroorotase